MNQPSPTSSGLPRNESFEHLPRSELATGIAPTLLLSILPNLCWSQVDSVLTLFSGPEPLLVGEQVVMLDSFQKKAFKPFQWNRGVFRLLAVYIF